MNSAVHQVSKKSLLWKNIIIEENTGKFCWRHKILLHLLQRPTHLHQDPHQILASFFFSDYHHFHCSVCLQTVYQSVKCSDNAIHLDYNININFKAVLRIHAARLVLLYLLLPFWYNLAMYQARLVEIRNMYMYFPVFWWEIPMARPTKSGILSKVPKNVQCKPGIYHTQSQPGQ